MSFFKKLFSKASPEKEEIPEPIVEKRPPLSTTSKPPMVARRQPLPLGTKPKIEEEIPTRQDPQELSISSLLADDKTPVAPGVQAPEVAESLPPATPEVASAPEAPAPSAPEPIIEPPAPPVVLSAKETFAFTAKQKALKAAKELLSIQEETTQFQIEALLRRLHKRYNWVQDNGSEDQQQGAKAKLQAIALVKSSLLND